ncbi:MAG: hypothetical protein CMH27_01670 [Micavibrio sp.]|nr:hypothetical protein [Micavibrio sp.]|tara:strand:+ start:1123 stop:1467 length:345 start_codon:yes stop_codon:yes gene_type:complete
MSILKTKLKILLVGVIVYQGALLMHKKEAGYTLPDINQAKSSFGITQPAYANENTGLPVNIPYSPYREQTSAGYGQMETAARVQARQMLQSGDTSSFKKQLMNDPYTRQLMGMH